MEIEEYFQTIHRAEIEILDDGTIQLLHRTETEILDDDYTIQTTHRTEIPDDGDII